MRAIANATTLAWHGGAIERRHQLPHSLQWSSSPRIFCQLNLFGHFIRDLKPITMELDSCRSSVRANAKNASAWDDNPYEILTSGKMGYLDEEDVVTFLDPPKELIPLDPSFYNPASYLWKKIENIAEQRRHHLLSLLSPRLILRAWEIAGTRYDDPNFMKKKLSKLPSNGNSSGSLELWKCCSNGATLPIAWISSFEKVLFRCSDGKSYGRLIGGHPSGIIGASPLYFSVKYVNEVMSTEQHCDLAYDFGDGLMDILEYPHGFPKPSKHPWPFNDEVVIYVRHVGPGVLVGQAWQEGEALEQVPKKLCTEILMVKDYSVTD